VAPTIADRLRCGEEKDDGAASAGNMEGTVGGLIGHHETGLFFCGRERLAIVM
jgi:hypothetical protein